ncbi:MAG TPA: MBL fold metallo-hydrolase [Gammaproteobacteria bacterium]|nr:MBL fold metallo-hydrolase [Gammaproteobacteria bacterium]
MTTGIQSFFHAATSTYSHVVWDTATRAAAIIDPALDFDPASGWTGTEFADSIADFVAKQDLQPVWILETHAHADHLSAAPQLKARFPQAQVAIGRGIIEVQRRFGKLFNLGPSFRADGSQFDRLLVDGETLPLGDLEIRAIATPGHTADSLAYLINDAVFVGDSIFMPDMGTARCDFPGGDARVLYRSIQKLFALPDETRLFMCHDYAPGGREHQYVTTVGEQKARNIHVGGGRTEDEFVRLRTERDATLPVPKLLFPAVQVNIRAGELPPPEDNGIAYLRIPLNAFGR